MRVLFEIGSASGAHAVAVSPAPLARIAAETNANVIIADEYFRDDLVALEIPIIFIPATEEQKEFSRLGPAIEACRNAKLSRSGVILAIGGGVIQDITCFLASVYQRGVAWSYVPTTLLAMVDSCIGGKSSINVGEFKNLVGTFYPPNTVIAAANALTTLPPIHIAAGRLEAAKICFARGQDEFQQYLELDGGVDPNLGRAADLIALSLTAKKWFIEIDEFDRAERLLLNFGHTFGHAIESATGYQIPHGVGVGVGCLAAALMSRDMSPTPLHPIVDLLEQHITSILRAIGDLPAALAAVREEEFGRFLNGDKKHSPTHYRFVIIDAAGRLMLASLQRCDASVALAWRAFAQARCLICALPS